jgi:hypothetical protein
MGEHGHTSTVFKRAIEFVILVALRDRVRSRRMCVRWLERYVGEAPGVEIETVAGVAGVLAALGGPDHLCAASALRDMTPRATGAAGRRAAE